MPTIDRGIDEDDQILLVIGEGPFDQPQLDIIPHGTRNGLPMTESLRIGADLWVRQPQSSI
jgi:hypothetical protein